MPTDEPFRQPLQVLLHQERESWGQTWTYDSNLSMLLDLSTRTFADTVDTNLTFLHYGHELLRRVLGNLTMGGNWVGLAYQQGLLGAWRVIVIRIQPCQL